MGGYIVNFTVYTLAMSGLIFFAFYIYKKVMNGSILPAKNHDMYIEETLVINPRKSLMVVNTGGERFLIASDVDKTTLISQLSSQTNKNSIQTPVKPAEKVNLEEVNKCITEFQNDKTITDTNDSTEKAVENTIEPESNEVDNIEDEAPDTALDELYGPVHLEVISNKNPNPIRRKHSYISKGYSKGKTVTIEVGANQGPSASPIKGIVQKVNNL